MNIKYIIHPGNVSSKYDGDVHYISTKQLIKLYKVNPKECLEFCEDSSICKQKKLIHLFPKYNGDYTIPNIN